MNLKLSTWTPSMLLKTRYKNLTRFIFVFPCGPSICMARFISIHPEFIFQSDGYQFIGIFWKVSEMAKVFRKPRVIYLCIYTILENVITWKILDYAKANWIFFYRFYALKPIKRYKIEQLIFKCKYDEYFIQLDTNTGHQPKFQRHFDSCSLSSMLCAWKADCTLTKCV